MNKPIVGITMGDPAGSGPEITIKALADPEQYTYCRPIVVGDVKVFERARKFVGREDIVIHRCDKVSDALFTPGTIDVLHLDLIEDINKFEMAKVSVEGGNAAFQCVKKVIELAMAGEVDATCTNALNKEAMNKALEYYHGEKSDGYTHFDGHTEIYATYIHIAAHDIEYRPTVEFGLFACRDVQFSADFKQILIARCIRIHGSKCLCMYLLSVYPIVTLRQEVMFSLNLNESGRHHRNPGFLCHLIIYHFHLRERKIVPFCKLQYVVGIALR